MNPFPNVVRIEPYGGNCNLTCRHCPTGLSGGRRGLMSHETFVTILDRLPAVPRVMVFYHSSEPFINRHLDAMVATAKERGVAKTVLNTNGLMAKLLPALDEMRVSFDGTSPEENDFIRRGSRFADVAPKIRALAEAGQRIVIYNGQVNGGARDVLAAPYLREYFGDLVTYRVEPIRLWAEQDRALEGYEVASARPAVAPRFCSNLFDTFTILADGTVPKCCEDLQGDFLYGNVLKELPLTIWERMERLRVDFAQGRYPDLCASCWVVAGRYAR